MVELLWTHGASGASTGRPERAARYARKFYPWYLERLGIRGAEANALQRTESLEEARALVTGLVRSRELAAQAA